jgi:hypothetical protein
LAGGWFVLREEYCWLVAVGWFVLREKYCWLVADKPSEQAELQLKQGAGWFVLREKYCWLVADKPSEQAELQLKQGAKDIQRAACLRLLYSIFLLRRPLVHPGLYI